MAGYTTTLLEGVATHLAATVPDLAWSPTGAYPPGVVGIYIGVMPPAPDRVVTLTAYPVEDHAGLTDDITAIQARTRGTQDPRVAVDLDDLIFDALHGIEGHDFNGVHVVKMWRNSGVPMGPDANRRYEQASNYYARTNRPTTHRTD